MKKLLLFSRITLPQEEQYEDSGALTHAENYKYICTVPGTIMTGTLFVRGHCP